jgi:hypothetical protein
MIHANELRIGNLVLESTSFTPSSKDFDVVAIASINDIDKVVRDNKENGYGYDMLYPIPLTSEWLELSGFNKISDGGEDFCDEFEIKNIMHIHYDGEDFWLGYAVGPKYNRNIAVTSLHQLQNLYFALTGEELTIKETV